MIGGKMSDTEVEGQVECYQCNLWFEKEGMNWISAEKPKRGLCIRCNEISKVKEKMENAQSWPGESRYGLTSMKFGVAEKIVCPHCGGIEDPYENDGWEDRELWEPNDGTERECMHCEKEFIMRVDVTFTYSTHIEMSWDEAKEAYEQGDGAK